MAVYIYTVSTIKYCTPTGTNTLATGTGLVALPNTVRGSVNLEESEGSVTDFFVDQQADPIMSVKTEEGKLTANMEFYDMTFANIAALKGGTGNASGYTPATGYTNILKGLEIATTSGHKFSLYNAQLITRVGGAGSRDKMFTLAVKATALMTTDLAGSWKVEPV